MYSVYGNTRVESCIRDIGYISKKRMDADQFAKWYERHKPECSSHHDGRAGQMELHDICKPSGDVGSSRPTI